MSSELHKYIETAIEKKKKFIQCRHFNFPKNKKINNSKKNNKTHWNINDNANNDQLKAVTGICLCWCFLLNLFQTNVFN